MIIDGIKIDEEFLTEWDDDFKNFCQKNLKTYQPNPKLPKKHRIKRGFSILPEAALYTAITITEENGSPDAMIIWCKKYPNGNVMISFKGLCPIHNYTHTNNNWCLIQPAKYWQIAYLKCFHDQSQKPIVGIPSLISSPSLKSWIDNYEKYEPSWELQSRWKMVPIKLENDGLNF